MEPSKQKKKHRHHQQENTANTWTKTKRHVYKKYMFYYSTYGTHGNSLGMTTAVWSAAVRTSMDLSAAALLFVTRWVFVSTRKHLVPSRRV